MVLPQYFHTLPCSVLCMSACALIISVVRHFVRLHQTVMHISGAFPLFHTNKGRGVDVPKASPRAAERNICVVSLSSS